MTFQADQAKAEGQRGMWHETHNAYTQVSSECGVPALICYLAALISSFTIFRKCRKSPDPDVVLMGYTLSVMLIGFGICIFFLALAYNVQFVTLGGIAIVLRMLLDQQARNGTREPTQEEREPDFERNVNRRAMV